MNYTKELEKQNEELLRRLKEAEDNVSSMSSKWICNWRGADKNDICFLVQGNSVLATIAVPGVVYADARKNGYYVYTHAKPLGCVDWSFNDRAAGTPTFLTIENAKIYTENIFLKNMSPKQARNDIKQRKQK